MEETGGPGENKSQVTDKLYHIMLYTLIITTLAVISTDWTDSCKSNYHAITAPRNNNISGDKHFLYF